MVERLRRCGWGVALLAAAAAGLALSACTDQTKLREAELSQMLNWIAGTYDNSQQALREERAGTTPTHDRVTLMVVRVYAPRLGHHAQYLQETATDDPRRVISQHMSSFSVDEKLGIVQTLYNFADPLRWRDGQQNPELFTGIVAEDVHEFCQLLWKKDGQRFSSTPDALHCYPLGDVAPADFTAEVTPNTLAFGSYQFRKIRQ